MIKLRTQVTVFEALNSRAHVCGREATSGRGVLFLRLAVGLFFFFTQYLGSLLQSFGGNVCCDGVAASWLLCMYVFACVRVCV